MATRTESEARRSAPVAESIRRRRDAILDRWNSALPELDGARRSSPGKVPEHLPGILDAIASAHEDGLDDPAARLRAASEAHARDRLRTGLELEHVVAELALLRECTLDLLDTEAGAGGERLLTRSFDQAIAAAVSTRDAAGSVTAERRGAELDAILKSVPDAIVVAFEGRIMQQNPAARELFGLDAARAEEPHGWFGAVEPRRLGDPALLPQEEWPVVIAERTGRPHVADLQFRHGSSGREVTVRVLAAPVRDRARPGAIVAVCTDITERRLIEAERERLVAALQETLQDREHVLAVVAHDLRNPLSTLGLAAHALAIAGPGSDIGQRAAATVERSTRRMERLIQDLLDASSIRAGRLALDLRLLSPDSVVTEVAESFAGRATEKGLELRVAVEEGLPDIRADHDRLVQALSNIVANAIKICSIGHVGLSVARLDGEVLFSISDTGPGVEPELQETLFEPFRRGKATYSGTGLGLAITRGIVEGHGGRLWLESAPGQGATFRIAIPGLRPGSRG